MTLKLKPALHHIVRIARSFAILFALFFMVAILVRAQAQVIRYVKQDGTGTGSSWSDASSDLQAMINISSAGDDVWVATGEYQPVSGQSFFMKEGVKIYGGFDPDNGKIALTDRILPQSLAAGQSGGSILKGNGSSVIRNSFTSADPLTGTAVLDGFTITAGVSSLGGGMYNRYSSPTLMNVEFSENTAIRHGGGMYNVDSSPILTNVEFSGNGADNLGGGMYNGDSSPILTNVEFSENTAIRHGGGMYNGDSSPILTNVELSGNTANGYGGGMFNSSSSPTLMNVEFSGNTANGHGGGMYNIDSSPILTNVEISGNTANGHGGGIFNNNSFPVLTNVEISGNSAEPFGGGIYNNNSFPVLTNVTISGNTASRGSAMYNINASSPSLFNSIVLGNGTASSIEGDDIDPSSSHNLIEGATTGNIPGDHTGLSATDIFVNPVQATAGHPRTDGDYSLAVGSPAVDAGNNQHYTDAAGNLGDDPDLMGNPRLFGPRIDLGAYEYLDVVILPATNNILYVNQSVPGGNGLGNSWNNAIPELADALQWAQENKDNDLWDADDPLKIYVAKGTYLPKYSPEDGLPDPANPSDNRDKTFLLVRNVQLYGGFDPDDSVTDLTHTRIIPGVTEGSPAGGTILSGDLDSNDGAGGTGMDENAYHVILSAGDVESALLDGFSITGGNANDDDHNTIIVNGQGDIRRYYGGGMYNENSSPTLTNVKISGNAANSGGGMYNKSSSPVLTNVTISGNTSSLDGGGMYNYLSSSPVLANVEISGNTASVNGGGLFNYYSSSPVLTNVTISGNTSSLYGRGMYNQVSSSPKLFNSIVYGNGATPSIEGDDIDPSSSHNLIDGGSEIYDIDHIFVNHVQATAGNPTSDDDYSLAAGSPAINAGSNQYYLDAGGDLANDLDLAGNFRLSGVTIDLGAYESTYRDIVAVSDPDPAGISVEYGTALADVPSTVSGGINTEVTLSDGSTVTLGLDSNTDNWVLTSPADGSYDPLIAGTYFFEIPVLLLDVSDPEWFSNSASLKATLEVTVSKGTPTLTAAWADTDIDPAEGLELTYGDVGALAVLHDNTDADAAVVMAFISGDPVLDLTDLSAAFARQAGTGILTITLAETDNFEAGLLEFEVHVAAKTLTVSASADQEKVYGEADPLFTYTTSGFALDDDADIFAGALARAAGEDADTYEIVLGTLNAGDNYTIYFTSAGFEITKAPLTVTADALTKIYGEADPALTYTVDAAGLQHNDAADVVSGSLERAAGEDVGPYEITNEDLTALNYHINYVNAYLTVTPAEITGVSFDDGDFVYDGTEWSLAITGTLPSGTSVSYSGNSRTDAGTQTVTATIDGGNNYDDLVLMAELTITPAEITGITFDDGSFVYDGSSKSLVITGTLPSGVSVSYSGNGLTDAGTQTVTAMVDGGNNYENITLTAELTITPAEITGITFDDASFVYDGTAKSLVITGTLPSGVSVSYSGNSRRDAGSQTVTATIDGGNNYDDLVLMAELTITPAEIMGITFDDESFVYDGISKSLTISGTLPSGVSVSYSGNGRTDAGTQTVTAMVDGGNNYVDLVLMAELTITPAEITGITFDAASFVYDGSSKSLTISGTLPAGTSVSYSGNGRTDVGMQTVTAIIDGGNNFENITLTAELTITSASRSIGFPAIADRTYGDAAFGAGATSSTGEPVLYSSSDPSVATVSGSGQVTITGAGEVSITATLTDNANYTGTPSVSRGFTVHRAAQTISHSIPGEVRRDAGSLPLTASASSGLALSLSVDDDQVATVSGHTLRVLRLGTVRITLSQAGNENYHAADPVTVTLQVVRATGDPDPGPDPGLNLRVHPAVSPNGDGINDFLMIEGIRDYPDNSVTVFDRNGNLVYEATGYNNGSVAFRGTGKSGQRLVAGTYFYVIEIRRDGQWQHSKGYLVLRY